MDTEKKIFSELKKINSNIDSISGSISSEKRSSLAAYLVVFLFVGINITILLIFGASIVGFVTFSESVIESDASSFFVNETGTVRVKTDLDNINSIMLSGRVFGNGKASVFLEKPERRYMAYYFEGNAGSGLNFSDMCYDTCHINGLGKENTLLFELENTQIEISKIKYLYSRIIDFDIEPKAVDIDYSKDPASIVELKLTNREKTNYTILLYADGPLSSSFSWQGSLIHMRSDEEEKIIPVKVKLPSNLPKGTYTNRITARYVPPDSYDFVGSSPVAEMFINVYN